MMHIISLGAGVQSTTMALMAAHGEITPMPDCAIFADTGAEPKAVYDHLAWLTSGNVLPFPVHIVHAKRSLKDTIGAARPEGKYLQVDIPAFVQLEDGTPGGLTTRNCTRDYKIRPIEKKVRELVALTGKRAPAHPVVTQWIGISMDEMQRMKDAYNKWQINRWPLIEKRMRRHDCLLWIERNGYPKPPRSACTFCPYHSNDEWRGLSPEDFAEAVAIDRRLRSHPPEAYGARGSMFVHRSCVPLEEADLSTGDVRQIDMFNDECDGMCGV